jgi:3-hydroxyisobutyrate dehydrogenase-like beta-hydroxyacid dehydrogenase
MAGRLAEHLRSGQAAGFDPSLIVYNRTALVAEAFASNTGATAVKAVADLATASVVFSMLPNDAVADAVTRRRRGRRRRRRRRCRRCWLPSLCCTGA